MSHNSGDLRVRRTQKLLREALIALIEERSFDAITVGEIAERAMVSRAAFCALLGGKGSPWFRTTMRAYLAGVLFERTQELTLYANRKHIVESRVFAEGLVPTLLAGLLIDAITWWLEHGRPYPPRHIATYCHRLMLSNLREVSKWEVSSQE